MSTPPKILYVCACCHENAPEGCGRPHHKEIAIMPDGTWLCEGCYADMLPSEKADYGLEVPEDDFMPSFDSLPHPEPYENGGALA